MSAHNRDNLGNDFDVKDVIQPRDWGLLASLGVAYSVTSGLDVLLEGQFEQGLQSFENSGTPEEDTWTNRTLSASLGLRWGPGGAAAKPAIEDADQDQVPDADDKCADQAEDRDGFQDDDGCPDPDNDGDAIEDAKDKCPDQAEDVDDFEDEDGCPDLDNDGDGVPDDKDRCATEAEDKNDFQDDDGCPDATDDADEDAVLDPVDRCLDAPGFYTQDGCPKKYEHVVVAKDRIAFKDDAGESLFTLRRKRATDKLDPASEAVLDEVAKALAEHPGIVKVEVQAYTAKGGRAQLQLSQRQAKAIRAYLVDKHQIAEDRLSAKGMGNAAPPADPLTEKSGARDVIVIAIVDQAGAE